MIRRIFVPRTIGGTLARLFVAAAILWVIAIVFAIQIGKAVL